MPPKRKAKSIGKPIGCSATGKRLKADQDEQGGNDHEKNQSSSAATEDLRSRFLNIFELPKFKAGISNSDLQKHFPNEIEQLAGIINELSSESRIVMSRTKNDLFYNLLAEEEASKFHNLDQYARLVYSVIEKAGNEGIWTRDIRGETNLQTSQLTKIYKQLEGRQLIKPVKSVNAKTKKLYMLYDLTPSTNLTGGIWYSADLEYDHEFINEMRNFLLLVAKKKNNGNGVVLKEFHEMLTRANISRVSLGLPEVQQLLDTLVFDYHLTKLERVDGDHVYKESPKITSLCKFGCWDVLDSDFHFRAIRFEDGVTLEAHEPHCHTK